MNELTKRLLESGLWSCDGRTPQATVGAKLYTDIKKKGSQSQFVQAGKVEEHAVQPSELGARITYLADPTNTGNQGRDRDFAIPIT